MTEIATPTKQQSAKKSAPTLKKQTVVLPEELRAHVAAQLKRLEEFQASILGDIETNLRYFLAGKEIIVSPADLITLSPDNTSIEITKK